MNLPPSLRDDFTGCKYGLTAANGALDATAEGGSDVRAQGVPLLQVFRPQLNRSRNVHQRQVRVHADSDCTFAVNSKSARRFGGDQRRDPFERKPPAVMTPIEQHSQS